MVCSTECGKSALSHKHALIREMRDSMSDVNKPISGHYHWNLNSSKTLSYLVQNSRHVCMAQTSFFSWKILFGLSQPSKILFYIFVENHVAFDTFSSKKIICTKQTKKNLLCRKISCISAPFWRKNGYINVPNAFIAFPSITLLCKTHDLIL